MPELHFRPKESEGPPMKKRLLSLLVALCMAVTLLPVSALTAWAEGGDQLRIVDGYPVGSGGEGWSYDGTTLDLHPASSTEYDFLSIISGNGNVTKCKLTIGGNATIVRGNFDNTVINNGKISGGYFILLLLSQIMALSSMVYLYLPYPMNLKARLKMARLDLPLPTTAS